MGNFLTHKYSGLLAHRMAICLFLALFILSFGGVGDIRTTSLLGLILCMAGSMQPSARVDLCIWIPLLLYNLFSMASSYAVYGNITEGYASTQMIFPVLYLLMACLDQKELLLLRQLCASWATVVAAVGIFQFVKQAVLQGSVSRLSGVLGNPNATGIFLVLSWFVLMDCLPESQENRIAMLLHCLEPILLIAATLTLSMGSFVAMAVGIFVFAVQKRKNTTGKETIYAVFCLLARASLGIGTGILLYLAAARTDFPWICIPLLLYSIFMVFCWPDFINFLAEFQKSAVAISTIGILAAIAAIIIRSGAVSTFIERFEMMHSGMKYLRNCLASSQLRYKAI